LFYGFRILVDGENNLLSGESIMKCFTHEKTDALAVCRSCGRGLCRDCIAEIGLSCSCKGGCEEVVATMNYLVERGRTRYQLIFRLGILFGIMAVAGVASAAYLFVINQSDLGFFTLVPALALLALSLLTIGAAKGPKGSGLFSYRRNY
jgi:hypothetical protein